MENLTPNRADQQWAWRFLNYQVPGMSGRFADNLEVLCAKLAECRREGVIEPKARAAAVPLPIGEENQ